MCSPCKSATSCLLQPCVTPTSDVNTLCVVWLICSMPVEENFFLLQHFKRLLKIHLKIGWKHCYCNWALNFESFTERNSFKPKKTFTPFSVSAVFISPDMHHKTIIIGTLHKTENNTRQMFPCLDALISAHMYITYTDAYVTQSISSYTQTDALINVSFHLSIILLPVPPSACSGFCLEQWMEEAGYPPGQVWASTETKHRS